MNFWGHYKYANLETIYVTPAPVVTGIQANYMPGNNRQFEGTGVQHTQVWFWDSGDGDTRPY